ncbi:ilvE [Symbiodinium pilosum]|uniref:IlvE protein n=1 Tax=Symbiodinium pilosum TaxID=2952 RepID=A0A812VVC3_SYMPI|nr:ilvE [Symbiodinium pilosum]
MLLTCDTVGEHTPHRGFDVFTFVQPLPYVEPMVRVSAHPAERSNPTIKDVQWVQDRQHLEEIQQLEGVNEVIMYDCSGQVTEGLQTNFFAAWPDGSLQTACDERVLAGTVRKVVLDVAREHGIAVRFECPRIEDAKLWESCFICSTSRLVKPVCELAAREHSRQSKAQAPAVEQAV